MARKTTRPWNRPICAFVSLPSDAFYSQKGSAHAHADDTCRSLDSNSRSQIATERLSKKQPNDQYVRTNARFTRVCV